MSVEVRPATRADVLAFSGEEWVGPTLYAMVGLVDGETVAIGGLAFVQGKVVAFCDLTDAARRYPVTLHKTALAVMAEAHRRGHKFIYAKLEDCEPTARRWLERLGFKMIDDGALALWQR